MTRPTLFRPHVGPHSTVHPPIAHRSIGIRRCVVSLCDGNSFLFFAVVTAFVLLLIGLAIGVSSYSSQLFGRSLSRYLQIHRLRTALSAAHQDVEVFLLRGDERLLPVLDEHAEATWDAFRRLDDLGISDRLSRFELSATYHGLVAYDRAVRRSVREYQAERGGYYFTAAYAERVAAYVDMYLERMLKIQLDLGRDGYRAARARQAALEWWAPVGIVAIGGALTLFALLFSRSVSRPLDRIVEEAHALAGGDFNRPPLVVPESEELREVALAFNRMSDGIRRLVADLKDKHELERRLHTEEVANVTMERLLRESQLLALQRQINPHFLFNTLNSISRTARIEGAGRSETLIRGLASVLRAILRNPQRSVSVREELRIVTDYLELQKVRFGSRLIAEVVLEPQAESAHIPPLIIQPVVENAVMYGIEPREEGGKVLVEAYTRRAKDEEVLYIQVSDDGEGIDPELVRHLMQDEPDTSGESTTGVGLLNVRSRLELFYGRSHRFDLQSRLGGGTVVTITVPLSRRSEIYGVHYSDR